MPVAMRGFPIHKYHAIHCLSNQLSWAKFTFELAYSCEAVRSLEEPTKVALKLNDMVRGKVQQQRKAGAEYKSG
jgi:hypothetical protein